MTTFEIRNGHAIQTQLEADQQPLAYDMTFIPEAPFAIGQANISGSHLLTGPLTKPESKVLLNDLTYAATNLYSKEVTAIDPLRGVPSRVSMEESFAGADRVAPLDKNHLLIINNLDELIGVGDEEPTKAQKFAIDSLMKWTVKDDGSNLYGIPSSFRTPRKICALMQQPELATHPLRARLVGSFASSSALAGSAQAETPSWAKRDYPQARQLVAA